MAGLTGHFAPTPAIGGRSAARLGQGEQALVVGAAGLAALEVGAHARNQLVGWGARELELDVAVELREALLAAQLRSRRAERPPQRPPVVSAHRAHPSSAAGSSSPSAKPSARRRRRSLRRASCSVLYSAPRVVFRRSAITSIGTPLI